MQKDIFTNESKISKELEKKIYYENKAVTWLIWNFCSYTNEGRYPNKEASRTYTHQKNEITTQRMGENTCKSCNFRDLHSEYIKNSCYCLFAKQSPTLFATLWTIARQAPLSMRFPRQEYQSGLPLPSPGDLPNSKIKAVSCTAGGYLIAEPQGSPKNSYNLIIKRQHNLKMALHLNTDFSSREINKWAIST